MDRHSVDQSAWRSSLYPFIERLLVQHRRTVLVWSSVFFGLLFIGIAFATNRVWLPWMTRMMSLSAWSLSIFFALIVLGVPVGFALLNAALVFLCFSPTDSDGRAAAEHGGRYNKLRAARDTVFHLRRRHHGAGRP